MDDQKPRFFRFEIFWNCKNPRIFCRNPRKIRGNPQKIRRKSAEIRRNPRKSRKTHGNPGKSAEIFRDPFVTCFRDPFVTGSWTGSRKRVTKSEDFVTQGHERVTKKKVHDPGGSWPGHEPLGHEGVMTFFHDRGGMKLMNEVENKYIVVSPK